jgi:hypothetical protein
MNKERTSAQWLMVGATISRVHDFDWASFYFKMKSLYFVSPAGTDEVEWCFSQVKGTVEEEVTEGRRQFLFDSTRTIVNAKCKQQNGIYS